MSMDHQKEKLGRSATYVWLIGGAILFLRDGGISNLISLWSLVFLFAGMFAAAVVVGGMSWWLIKKQARYLMEKYGELTTETAHKPRVVGGYIFFWAVHYLLGILFLLWCYNSFY